MYFLDTDTCIEILRGKLPYAHKRMRESSPELFGIPAIVVAELRLGAQNSRDPEEGNRAVDSFLRPFHVIPFDEPCAFHYADIRHDLQKQGTMIGANDLLIAATALAHGAVLVTNNTREFLRVKGLHIESWAEIDL